MTFLLDTKAFYSGYLMINDWRKKSRKPISNSLNNVYISNLILLECSIKIRLGKLNIDFYDVDKEIS